MVDEANKTAVPDKTVAETAKPADVPVQEPSLAEDYLRLEQINLLRSVVVRMQGGQHPDKSIEALLRRRLNFSSDEFQGPYAIRLVCTLMMIFVVSALVWAIFWAIGSAMDLSYFLRLISTGFATLFAAMAGVALFHPSSIPEEKKLIEAIEARMVELRKELGKDEKQDGVGENAGNDSTANNVQADSQPVQATASQTLKTEQVTMPADTGAVDAQESPAAAKTNTAGAVGEAERASTGPSAG
ncbi:MAG: hypothetical protein KKB51_04695 [Candidatus Riflebacteria bacterium]|nr:hypothetical protein [Candidatus Riflebacteria bacterium]